MLPLSFPTLRAQRSLTVGNPVHVTQTDKPTLEEIMEVQKRYIEELTRYATLSSTSPSSAYCHRPGYGIPTRTILQKRELESSTSSNDGVHYYLNFVSARPCTFVPHCLSSCIKAVSYPRNQTLKYTPAAPPHHRPARTLPFQLVHPWSLASMCPGPARETPLTESRSQALPTPRR